MLPYKSLIQLDKKLSTAIYLQIANRFINLIQEGLLSPGSRLPSVRELAEILGVHHKTIVAVYEELALQDWTESRPRKGIFVSTALPTIKPRTFKTNSKQFAYLPNLNSPSSLEPGKPKTKKTGDYRLMINDGFPDARIAPIDILLREYKRLYHRASVQRRVMFGDVLGAYSLRYELSRFLTDTRGLIISEANILVTRGAQMALYILARMLLKPGSVVMVGEPNYPYANMLFQECGARLEKIKVDENGMDVDEIERKCRLKKPDLLYIIPHHHHPTTVTLSANRRMKLLETIKKYKLSVIEDDYDYDFHYNSNPILPLASGDHNGTIFYVGSLTKSLTSTLKIGYVVATEDWIKKISDYRRLIDLRGDNMMEEALATLFKTGDMQRHLKKSLKLYHQRRDFFYHLIDKELKQYVSVVKPNGGLAFWAKFDSKTPLQDIATKASDFGLHISNGTFYSTSKVDYNSARLGFASLNEGEVTEIVSILKKCLTR